MNGMVNPGSSARQQLSRRALRRPEITGLVEVQSSRSCFVERLTLSINVYVKDVGENGARIVTTIET
ncbi:MAG: hypothetical protein U1E61_12735 [Bradyrhizobium sp.]